MSRPDFLFESGHRDPEREHCAGLRINDLLEIHGISAGLAVAGYLRLGDLVWDTHMSPRTEIWQGTLALMILKTLHAMGPQHGYGIARRIEQTSENLLSINHGTLYPVLLKLEQEGAITSEWGVSDNNRRAKFYRLTKSGKKQLESAVGEWAQATGIVARFLALKGAKG